MLSSAFLFYGENAYTLNQQLAKRKLWFIEKYGQDSLFEFNSENWELGEIRQTLYAGGLFVTKKLVILYGIPKDTYETNNLWAEKIEKFFEEFQQRSTLLGEDVLVVFVSYKPDKRTKAFKWCSEHLQLKEFAPARETELKTFIKQQLETLSISEEVLDALLIKVGSDMYRLEHECEKLVLGLTTQGKTQVQISDLTTYCFWKVETDAFVIFDQLFYNPQKAVQTLQAMQEDGKVWNEIIGLLTRGLKIYLTLIAYHKKGIHSAKEIIAQTKLHPFVVNKNLKQINILLKHEDFLVDFFKELVDLEYEIKTGKYPDHYFWPKIKGRILNIHS